MKVNHRVYIIICFEDFPSLSAYWFTTRNAAYICVHIGRCTQFHVVYLFPVHSCILYTGNPCLAGWVTLDLFLLVAPCWL